MPQQPQPLVNKADFTGSIRIADLSVDAVEKRLCDLIARVEPEVLTNALGYGFAAAFRTAYAVNPLEERWTDLVEGCVWGQGGRYQFDGLRRVVALHVYYQWMKNYASSTTSVGEAVIKAAGAEIISNARKMKDAWNEAADDLENMWVMLVNRVNEDGTATYTGFDLALANPRKFYYVNNFGL